MNLFNQPNLFIGYRSTIPKYNHNIRRYNNIHPINNNIPPINNRSSDISVKPQPIKKELNYQNIENEMNYSGSPSKNTLDLDLIFNEVVQNIIQDEEVPMHKRNKLSTPKKHDTSNFPDLDFLEFENSISNQISKKNNLKSPNYHYPSHYPSHSPKSYSKSEPIDFLDLNYPSQYENLKKKEIKQTKENYKKYINQQLNFNDTTQKCFNQPSNISSCIDDFPVKCSPLQLYNPCCKLTKFSTKFILNQVLLKCANLNLSQFIRIQITKINCEENSCVSTSVLLDYCTNLFDLGTFITSCLIKIY